MVKKKAKEEEHEEEEEEERLHTSVEQPAGPGEPGQLGCSAPEEGGGDIFTTLHSFIFLFFFLSFSFPDCHRFGQLSGFGVCDIQPRRAG